MDICYKILSNDEKYRFNYRVAAIMMRDQKILIQKGLKDDFSFLPGGRVTINETSQDAILRELKEELDINATLSGTPFIIENFFTVDDERFHEISLFFTVDGKDYDLPEDAEIRDDAQYFWINPQDAATHNLKPSFLISELMNIPQTLKHIIHFDKSAT